jgi:2'-phosphotransferase
MESTGRGSKGRSGGKDVALSKRLSYILRHGALELGLSLRSDGYVPLDEVLQLKDIKSMVN